MNRQQYDDTDVKSALMRGQKPLLHHIILTETKDKLDLDRITRFYIESLYFHNESSKIQPQSRFTIEPRFALGNSKLLRALAPLASAKIQKYGIRQIIAPGYGGFSGLMCFVTTGIDLNWAALRIDQPKQSRILTALDGCIDRNIPVWITDDLLSSGNAALKTIRILRKDNYIVAGFIPIVVDLGNNIGPLVFETLDAALPFKFDYLIGLRMRDEEKPPLAFFDRSNKAIHDP